MIFCTFFFKDVVTPIFSFALIEAAAAIRFCWYSFWCSEILIKD